MYRLIRPLLYRFDAERAHQLTLRLIGRAGISSLGNAVLRSLFEYSDRRLEVQAFGLTFRNPVGLAAGYDKDGLAVKGLSALGFGHVEVGTVTRQPQGGNPRPRIFRVPEAGALVNSMGFPNAGVDALVARHIGKSTVRLGVNLGKSKDTPLERAAEDYIFLLSQVHSFADYGVLNVSSPNTPGLRELQRQSSIEELLKAVTGLRDALRTRVPLLVKIAPDLTESEIDAIVGAVLSTGIDGIIATNTTVSRESVPEYAARLGGGLSGAPLRSRSTDVVRRIARVTEGKLPIIGVGGIASAADALEKLKAGASLIQVYTGLVYQGPGLVRRINVGLAEACQQAGASNLRELLSHASSL